MKFNIYYFVIACLFLSACNSATPAVSPEPISIQYTAAAAPWLATLNGCTGDSPVVAEQRAADLLDPQSFDLALRVGQLKGLDTDAFQVGKVDIEIIVNSDNHVQSLTAEQVLALFTGRTGNWQDLGGREGSVQVWVLLPGDDIWQVFEQAILKGHPITSLALLAADQVEMEHAVASDINAVGVLTNSWITENTSVVYSIPDIPVLALVSSDRLSIFADIISCLQRKAND
jgi:hypothetical protein